MPRIILVKSKNSSTTAAAAHEQASKYYAKETTTQHVGSAGSKMPAAEPDPEPLIPPKIVRNNYGRISEEKFIELEKYINQLLINPTASDLKKLFADNEACYILFRHPRVNVYGSPTDVFGELSRSKTGYRALQQALNADSAPDHLLRAFFVHPYMQTSGTRPIIVFELIADAIKSSSSFAERLTEELIFGNHSKEMHDQILLNLTLNHFSVRACLMYYMVMPQCIGNRHNQPSLLERLIVSCPSIIQKITDITLSEERPGSIFWYLLCALKTAPSLLLTFLVHESRLIQKIPTESLLLERFDSPATTYETCFLHGLFTSLEGLNILNRLLDAKPDFAREIYSEKLLLLCKRADIKKLLDAVPLGQVVLQKIKQGEPVAPVHQVTVTLHGAASAASKSKQHSGKVISLNTDQLFWGSNSGGSGGSRYIGPKDTKTVLSPDARYSLKLNHVEVYSGSGSILSLQTGETFATFRCS